jgi:ArsR family transcriptional regulator
MNKSSRDMSDAHEERCGVDKDTVRRLQGEVHRVEGLGTLFKALSDETRAKIMFSLLQEELCVGEVARILGMSEQAVSHHLRLLRIMRLVKCRREGKFSYYSLDDSHVARLIGDGMAHIHEHDGGA